MAARCRDFVHPSMAVLESQVITWKLQGHWRLDSVVSRRQSRLQGEVGIHILLL